MTYTEQLQDPRWQRKRLEILQRDDFRCCMCNDSENELHVHHLYYLPKLKAWEYDNECYVSLCTTCHDHIHNVMPKIVALISFTAIKSGLTLFDISMKLNNKSEETLFRYG